MGPQAVIWFVLSIAHFTVLAYTQTDQQICLPGWNVTLTGNNKNVCYKKVVESNSWRRGKEICGEQLGFMISADVIPIADHILHSGDYWTGGHFDDESGKFYWDGIPLLNMKWSSSFPTPFTKTGDCVSLNLNGTVKTLRTRPCDEMLPVVCENKGFTPKLKTVAKCGSGWLGAVHLDICYKHHSEPLLYADAEQRCQNESGHLARPSDEFLRQHAKAAVASTSEMLNRSASDKTYIGLSFDGNFKWSDGNVVDPSFNVEEHFAANETQLVNFCYVMVNESIMINQSYHYQKVPCTELHPFICEKNASLSPVSIIEQPSDEVLYFASFVILTTHLYYPTCAPAGDFFAVSSRVNGLPTQGSESGDTKVVGADDFGVFICEAWNYKPFSAVRSPAVVIKQFGTRSFVGSLKMPNSTFGESHALYNWFSRYSPAPAEVKTVETTLRLHLDNAVGQAYPGKIFVDYGSIVVVSFNNLTSGLGVDFRLTTYSDQYQEPPSDLENLLDVLQLAMKTFTGGHIDLQSIILLSAEYCYPTRITDGDVMITFPMSSPGTIPSEQICGTTGQPLGELTCVGNFTIGLSWVSPRVIPCNEQESSVTGTLRNLSKVAFNVSNIKSLTKEIAEVTSNASTELNYADIIYVSRMVSRVTLLVNVSQQVVKNVLHIFDNVMRANDSVIANSQEVDGASSRLTRAMEIITGRVHIDLSSSFVQTLPNIAIGTFYVGVNETNKVSGIQLFTNATSDGIRKTSVQPLYNVGVNRSINSTDLTIKLPMSLVDPKGVLHLFNETRNTKILFSKKVTVASTNVSDCAFQCTGKLQSTMSSEVCVGFNFNRALKTCELCNTFTSYEYLAPEVGWSSYVYVPEWSLGQQTSFILYNNWKLFQTRFQISANYSSVRKWETYSKVISAKINTRSAMQLNLEDPLTTSFLPVKRDNATNVTTVCGYWDYQLGDFSQEGCWSNGTVGLRHVCMCDHLTNFALLLDVHSTFIAENYYETSADRDEDEPDKPSDDDKPTDEGPAEHQTTIGYDLAEQVSTIGQDPDQQVTPNDEEQEANGASVDKGQDVKETGVDIDQNGNGTSVGNGQDVNGAGVDQGQNVNGTGVDIDQNGNGTSVGNVQDVNGTGVDQGQNVNGTGVGKDQDENESSVGNIHGLDGTTVDKGQDVNGITIDPGQGVHDEDTTQGKNSTTANNNHGTYGNYMDEGNKLALSVISIAGLSLSIVGLLCTIVTFLLSRFFSGCCTEHSYGRGFRALGKGPSQQTIFNLSLALLLSVVLFLGGVEQVKDKGGCIAVAVLLHYLILVSFAWMLVEGVLQYLRFVKVMATYIPGFMKKAYLLAWGVPLLFTVIPLAVNPGLYGGKNCWLSRDLFYFAFMVPVCTVIFVNSVIFVLVIRSFKCGRKKLRSNQSERTAAILRLNAGISTLFLLGITWVFGFLAINEARIAFQYIFCICNSLQGFFIFIFFNVREKQVRDAWCSLLCRRKRKVSVISISPQSQSKRNTPTKTTVLADGLNSDEYKPSDALNSDTYSLSSGVNSDEYRSSGGLNSEKYTPSDHLKLKELTSPDVLNSAKCMSSSGQNSDKHTPSEGLNSYKYMPSCDLELEEYTLSDDGN